MLCRICSVFDHPNHHLVTLPEGRRLFEQQDMRRRQDHLSDLLIRDKELLAETQQSLLQMDSEKCVIVQEMERLCERLSEDITERMREVAEEIEGMSVDKGRRVREQTEQIGRHLKEREEMLERIEEIIRGGDHQVSGSGLVNQ
jgi:DNA anti-recombination protein RmuC